MRPTRPSGDGARDEIVAKTSSEALELLVVHFFTCQGPNIPLCPVWTTVGLMCSGAHKKTPQTHVRGVLLSFPLSLSEYFMP